MERSLRFVVDARLAVQPGSRGIFIKGKDFMSIFNRNIGRMLGIAVVAAGVGLGAGIAVARQPQMDGALSALQSAQGYLNEVTMDKGGHAAKARRLVAEAIAQVQEGIAYGEAHGE
jgi:hypothetical protein